MTVKGQFPRRTLLGRALSLLGGLCAGLLGGHKKAKAKADAALGKFIPLDTGIRMDSAEAARFAAEYTKVAVKDGRVVNEGFVRLPRVRLLHTS